MEITMKIIIASQNQGKLKEFKSILEPLGYEVLSAADLDVNLDDVVEDGLTFADNALIKARVLHERTGYRVISDDSGLCISALPDIVGVHSARYMGYDTPYEIRNATILSLLEDKEDKSAAFHSVIALVGEGTEDTFEGIIEGTIGDAKGTEGFGYDPIFYPLNSSESFASMDLDAKNKISHRALAIEKLLLHLQKEQS